MKHYIVVLLLFISYNISAQYSKQNRSVGMTISLPLLNNYRFYDYGNYASTNAWGGLSIGCALFYKHDKIKYSLNFVAATTYDLYFYDPYGFSYVNTEAIVHYTFIRKLNIIGGVNMAKYHYNSSSDLTPIGIDKTDYTFGLTSGLEYMFSKTFSIAMFYRPALYSFGIKSYKRTLSLDTRFDIRFWNKLK